MKLAIGYSGIRKLNCFFVRIPVFLVEIETCASCFIKVAGLACVLYIVYDGLELGLGFSSI